MAVEKMFGMWMWNLSAKKADLSTFEDLKVPHLGEAIFDRLDDQSVIKCVEVNEILKQSYWIWKIKCFFAMFLEMNRDKYWRDQVLGLQRWWLLAFNITYPKFSSTTMIIISLIYLTFTLIIFTHNNALKLPRSN